MSPSTHLRASLWSLALFLGMGMGLEVMLGLRVPALVDDALRREFLRLGHAHGGLLALVNVALAWALQHLATPPGWAKRIRLAAWLGTLLVGFGFVGGAVWHGPTDPGPVVLLVPAGALLMLSSLLAAAVLRPAPGQTSNKPS
ncbi:MAG: hypothetical protein ACRBN8_37660 [Nannocystales bacterium]